MKKRKHALPDNALSGETLLIAPLLRPHNASQLAYQPARRTQSYYLLVPTTSSTYYGIVSSV